MRSVANIVSQSKKLLAGSALSIMLGVGLLAAPMASALTIGGPSDCDDNAIVRCGVHSTSAIVSAYQGSAYVRAVYGSFGISQGDINNLMNTNVAGRVTKDGNVFIDSQSGAVASNAVTGGRQDITGSTQVNAQGAVFFRRPPSVSFQQQSLPAFVAMQNGQFQFAIIASCGNAVSATPKAPSPPPHTAVALAKPVSKPPAKPAPAPTPTQTQSQQQQQSQQVNVTNTNTQNVQTTPTSQPQPTTQSSAQQPAAQQTASQPSSLVNTGPSGLVGAFVLSAAAGTFAFRRLILHRFNN